MITMSAQKPKNPWSGFVGFGFLLVACVVIFFAIPELVRTRYSRAANVCANNLRVIAGAKQQWFLENKNHASRLPTPDDLRPYISRKTNDLFPLCPTGGDYVIGVEGAAPRCSIGRDAWPNAHNIDGTDYSWWDNFISAYRILLGLMPLPDTGRR
jgi:hypothetical protein